MTEVFLQYGILGAVVVGLAGYILKIESRHSRERKEWKEVQEKQFDKTIDMAEKTHQTLRDNTNVLAGLKTLLENRR